MHRLLVMSLAAIILVAAAAGAQTREPGRSDTLRDISERQRRELDRLATLGYLAGGDPAPDVSGVTISLPEAWEGYTVYVSGDFSGAFLVDMDGRVLHTWDDPRTPVNQLKQWTRVWVEPDGSALGVTRYPARLRKLTWDSELLWSYGDVEQKIHHDVQVAPDGRIYVLANHAARLTWLRDKPVLDESVCILEEEGASVRKIDCIALSEAFRTSEYADSLFAPWFGQDNDIFHANSLCVLEGRVPHAAFRPGNVLLSLRSMYSIAVLDLDLRQIVWMNRGRWQRQHEARETPDGHVMLFDNRTFDGQSRVVEYDVVANEVVWNYTADGFFSPGSGAQQLLPNGNVLVTESQKGRILEVARDGRTVWEYWNPRTLDRGRTIERIKRAFRVPYDFFVGEFGAHLTAQRNVN